MRIYNGYQLVQDIRKQSPAAWNYEMGVVLMGFGIHYTKAVSGAGLGGTPYRDGSYEYYVSEPKRDDDLKAIGPFIQACIEINSMKGKK